MPDHDTEHTQTPEALTELAADIRAWAHELGFQSVGICATTLTPHDQRLRDWVAAGRHGDMDYMERHGDKRWRPDALIPGTQRLISVRMDYRHDGTEPLTVLQNPQQAYVSRYALGRDYHKLMRARLARLADPHPRRTATWQALCAPSSTAHRYSNAAWHKRRDWAGSARTRC
jgi:epoxyqueuosine reductase